MFVNYMDYTDDAAMFMFTAQPGECTPRSKGRASQSENSRQ